jgi:DNA primase catalytic core
MIPAEEIAAIRARHDLVTFIEAAGIKLKRKGRDLVGLCPFHDDRGPSLSVSVVKQYWCCLGACSAGGKTTGGDVIEFARRIWQVGFREALERLGGNGNGHGSHAVPNTTAARPAPRARAAKSVAPPSPDLLTQVTLVYHQALLASADAKDYLAARGITNPELVAALTIGHADGALAERAPEGSETRAALEALGVIAANGRELMHGSIVVPLRDLGGHVVGLYGRPIARDGHFFLTGPRRGLVNAQCAATCDEIVITESVFDALSFLEAGIPNAVPIYGTHGWTPDHDALLDQRRVRRVVLALDSDPAGRHAANELREKLTARGIAARVVELPAKDANELLVREGREGFASIWRRLLAQPDTAAAVQESAAAKEKNAPLDDEALDEPESQPTASPTTTTSDTGYVIQLGPRAYRVRGLSAVGVDRMRVNVRVEQAGRVHVDTLDLYAARARRNFVEDTAAAFGLPETDLPALQGELGMLIERLESERLALRRKGESEPGDEPMSAADREEALRWLRDPCLTDRLREDFAAIGCVGEGDAMLVAYLAALSRKTEEPLSVIFCARSGAGKSNLQDRTTELVPPEDLVRYTRITGQALFYQDQNALKHKMLAIDEEDGAAEAAYSLRNLQSGGSLSVSATRTDPQTGKQRAESYKVDGPTAIFLTTTRPEALDYETRNRFVMLTVDESPEQTRRILERQRWGETLEGLVSKTKRAAVIRRHHNAQRLIAPLKVIIPGAESILFPSRRLSLRREQKKYLTLIKSIALLHQHQRRRGTITVEGERVAYIEATAADIALARALVPAILRRNLDDLAPPSRSLLLEIAKLVHAKMEALKIPQCYAHVSRQEIQAATGLSYWHLRAYLAQLVEHEYLAIVRGTQGKRFVYELLWEGEDDDPAGELEPK